MTGSDPLVFVYAGLLDDTYLGLEILMVDARDTAVYGVLEGIRQVPSEESIQIAIWTAHKFGVPDAELYTRSRAAALRHTHLLIDGRLFVVDIAQRVVTTAPSAALEPAPPLFP